MTDDDTPAPEPQEEDFTGEDLAHHMCRGDKS
jgi:hypothetical protein